MALEATQRVESGWRQIARTGGSLYCPKSHRQPTERWPSCREPASRSSSLPAWVEPVPVPPAPSTHTHYLSHRSPSYLGLPTRFPISVSCICRNSKRQTENPELLSILPPFSPLLILCLFLTSTGRYISRMFCFNIFIRKFPRF